MITIQCKLTPEDYIQANYLHIRPSPWVKYLSLACLALFIVIFTASLFTTDRSLDNPLIKVLSSVLPIFLFAGLYGLILGIIIPWNTRRIFAQQKTLQIAYEVKISAEMLETSSVYGNVRVPLSEFHKYKVGKNMILLYQSQYLFQAFPRRFFASEEDFQTFLAYLKTALGSPKS